MYNKQRRMDLTLQMCVYVFIIYFCSLQAYSNRYIKPATLNRKLKDKFRVKKQSSTSLQWCAEMCVYLTDCQSMNYNFTSKFCEMYTLNSTSATVEDYEVVAANGTAFIDITSWIQGRTGGCWEKPCGPSTLCMPNNQKATCMQYGCPLYLPPAHGWDNLNRSQGFANVGQVLQASCHWPYMTTIVDPKIYWKVFCNGNDQWSMTYECYAVEDLCRYHILEALYNNLTISVSGLSQWDTSQILFSSTSGWPSSNDCEAANYVQVTFEEAVWIGGVATKGDGEYNTWVLAYTIEHSSNCINPFVRHQYSNGTDMVYKGNNDANSIHRNFFEEALKVKCIRVHPSVGCGMRLEILTCKDYSSDDALSTTTD